MPPSPLPQPLQQHYLSAGANTGKNSLFSLFPFPCIHVCVVFFQLNCYITIHGHDDISVHSHNQEAPKSMPSLPLITEAVTGSTGMNFHSFPFLCTISTADYLFFQLNCYTTIHRHDVISIHSHNQEWPSDGKHR